LPGRVSNGCFSSWLPNVSLQDPSWPRSNYTLIGSGCDGELNDKSIAARAAVDAQRQAEAAAFTLG
jgi:hypothetical protein